MTEEQRIILAYIIGVALGDGNLSNPNGRATRLRVTCDLRYPNLAQEIIVALSTFFPQNKVSIARHTKGACFDVSVYSNLLNDLLPWKVGAGSKLIQSAHVPSWVFEDIECVKATLKGLVQTDGSIYKDRGYLMLNFTNTVEPLVQDVYSMMQMLGFIPRISKTLQKSGTIKYTVRLARDTQRFIETIQVSKT